MKVYPQQSDERRAYVVEVIGGTIASSDWTIVGGTKSAPSETSTTSTVLISGLTPRTEPYTLKAQHTLNDGQIADSEVQIACRK